MSESANRVNEMTPKRVKELLVKAVQAGLQILLVGPPGVGKTDLAHQVADITDSDLVVFHPVVSDPTDFKGLPGIVNGKAEFLPYGDLRKLVEAKRRTIAMFDDVGQGPTAVQAALMQLLWSREINGHKISDKVTFLAATNRREDKAGVTGMLEPLKSRFHSIVHVDVSTDDWCEWALENDVPPELVAFIRFRPDLLLSKEPPTMDLVNRASPRTITNMGKLYAAGLEDVEVLSGAAGKGVANEFIGFLKIFRDLPSIDGILLDPKGATVPKEPASLYAIVTALAQRATKDNAGRIITYFNRLREEFGVLGVKDMIRKDKGVQHTKEFVDWAVKHQSVLV